MSDAQQVAAGCFYTEAELRVKPWLRRKAATAAAHAADPNTRPVSAEARAMAESDGVCAYCGEPGDERSALADSGRGNGPMHPECQETWDTELAARRAR